MPDRRAVVLLLLLSAACGGGAASSVPTEPPPATPPFPVGQMTDQTLVVGGVTRQFRVHVPAGMTTPKAVVFVLHGGGGEGLDVSVLGQHALSVFRTVADREGFVVVYPAGLPANDAQRLPGWVDCRADLVGAVATGSGSLPVTPKAGGCTSGPSRPLPILLVHGSGDIQMPWGGGCVADIGGNCNRGRVISAEATRDRWLQINGLGGVTPTMTVVDSSVDDCRTTSHHIAPHPDPGAGDAAGAAAGYGRWTSGHGREPHGICPNMHPSNVTRANTRKLTDLPNVGPAMARDLELNGIVVSKDLWDRDPFARFKLLVEEMGVRQPRPLPQHRAQLVHRPRQVVLRHHQRG